MPVDAAKLDLAARRLAEKIIELRQRRGFTQEALAERSGLSRNQIQNIERCRNNTRDPETGRHGRGNPTLDTVFQLADALDIPVAILIDPDATLPPDALPTERPARPPRRR
jgi:transcriptional regulator with XRE-family HTH domain